MKQNNLSILIITNIPAPYRVPVFNRLAEYYGNNFKVFYCAHKESNRHWSINNIQHDFIILKGKTLKLKRGSFHINYDIVFHLFKYKPDIIINGGLSLTNIIAWLYSRIFNKRHIVQSDSWELPEKKLSKLHLIIRKIVFNKTDAFICVGKKGRAYFRSFNIADERIFNSPLAIDNVYYSKYLNKSPCYDLMFSGQFVDIKMPFFIIDVLQKIKENGITFKFLMIGSGPLEKEIIGRLKNYKIDYNYPGFIQQNDLPKYYSSAKILLFPSLHDPWGVVANEAMAVGVPVITCDNAGAANDLIIDGENGYVLPLDINIWAEKILQLLNDPIMYSKFSKNALEKVQEFNFGKSSEGIISAIRNVSNE